MHGEPERNDMVQYFAEQLAGYLATQHGWVQSYGTRYVRPPVLAGDISRPEPMTVRWTSYANSLTDRPVKGMLTGPVTMLAWSFVRDDQPLGDTARQVALALRDEVNEQDESGNRGGPPVAVPHLPSRVAEAPVRPDRGPGPVRVTLSIDGAEHAMQIEPRVKLLDAQHERLHMTGAEKGCDHIAQALVLGASAQLRHMAGMGATSRTPRRRGSGSRPVPPRSALP